MAEIQKYSLKEELVRADEKLTGSLSILGMTALTYPNYINSMRSTMFTSHLKQYLDLQHPEFPRLFTGAENLVGKHSTGYKKVKNKTSVYKKIVKFDDLIDNPNVYTIFLFDEKKKRFSVVTRKPVEDLTENFGFEYNNDYIDSLDEDDEIPAGTVLYRSTSYDEDMNFAYGRNANIVYTLDPATSEDAALASETFSKVMTSIETETISIGLNSNDYMLNMYGKNGEYIPLPNIGDKVSGYLNAIRRKFNDQVLFDFSDSSLREIHEGDTVYYIDNNTEVVDYTIYSNCEEIVDTSFNKQVNKYLRSQNKYYKKIIKTCEEIFDTGYDYSRDIDYLYKRAKEMLDTKKKWKEGDSAFSNMVIEITVKKVVPLTKGCKVTGRYGNKSVIAGVLPDDQMPYTKDGRRADLMLNLLAIINRTTSMVLSELTINSITYQVRQKMKAMENYIDREKLLFDILYMFNEDQYAQMIKEYECMSIEEQKEFIDDSIEDGIYINIPTMWEGEPIFYRLRNILKKYEWLKPDDMYIKKWGREYKSLNKMWFGEMYIMKLKQSDRRGFSARSTGAVDTKNLPTRSYKSRSHLEQYSGTAIRFGEFESLNFGIGTLPSDIALFHAMYRTSIKGRRDVIEIAMSDAEDGVIKKIDASYTSRVAEIFNVVNKSLSFTLDFVDEDEYIYPINNTDINLHTLNGRTYFCTDYQFFLIERCMEIIEDILEESPIITEAELTNRVEAELKSRKYLLGGRIDEFDEICRLNLLKQKEDEAVDKEEKTGESTK